MEARIRDMLMERGYELSGLPKLEVTRKMARRLARQSRRRTRIFRIRRYGLCLVLAECVTRRLGLARINKRLVLRCQKITNKHLK